MKVKRFIKRYYLYFISFFCIGLFASIVSSPIIDNSLAVSKSKYFFTNNVKYLDLSQNTNDMYRQFFKEIIKNNGFITQLFASDNELKLSGVYYNIEPSETIPMKSGRFLKVDDFKKEAKNVVIGKNLKSRVDSDNKFDFRGVKYEVVGVIDDIETNGIYNDTLFIDINNIIFYDDIKIAGAIKIEYVNGNIKSKITSIEKKLREKNQFLFLALLDVEDADISLKSIIGNNKMLLVLVSTLFLIIMSTLINILQFWIEEEKKNIGIKRLHGDTKKGLLFKIFCELESVILVAGILGFITYRVLNSTGYFELLSTYNNTSIGVYVSLIFVLILSFFTGILVIGIIARKIFSIEINSVIRSS